MKNHRLLIILFAAIFGFPNQSHAQVYGNSFFNWTRSNERPGQHPIAQTKSLNFNETSIRVNGLMNIPADAFVAMFNIIQVGETVESTHQLLNERISMLKKEMRLHGIDTQFMKVDMISFLPKYTVEVESKLFSKSYNEVPAGFILQKNITIQCTNSQKLNDITTAAAKAEIYDLVKVDYFVNEIEVDFNGQLIMKAQLTFSVSMDPAFRFYFIPDKEGVMTVKGTDTKN